MYVLASRLDVYVGIIATSRVIARTATYLWGSVSLLGPPGRDPQARSQGLFRRAQPQGCLLPEVPSRTRGHARGGLGSPA